MATTTVTLREWINADIAQQGRWLQSGVNIGKGFELFQWVVALREAGAIISDATVLHIYHRQWES